MSDLRKGDTTFIVERAAKHGVLRNQLAYILATTAHETAFSMKPVYETYYLGEPRATQYNRKKPYWPHYGRGYVQLTWATNYADADEKLGLGGALIEDPELALQPDIAAEILVRGMMEGWFTGKKIPDYITLQQSDFVNARRVVNGTDKASEIAELARGYDAALKVAGYGEETGEDPDIAAKLQRAIDLLTEIKASLT